MHSDGVLIHDSCKLLGSRRTECSDSLITLLKGDLVAGCILCSPKPTDRLNGEGEILGRKERIRRDGDLV